MKNSWKDRKIKWWRGITVRKLVKHKLNWKSTSHIFIPPGRRTICTVNYIFKDYSCSTNDYISSKWIIHSPFHLYTIAIHSFKSCLQSNVLLIQSLFLSTSGFPVRDYLATQFDEFRNACLIHLQSLFRISSTTKVDLFHEFLLSVLSNASS